MAENCQAQLCENSRELFRQAPHQALPLLIQWRMLKIKTLNKKKKKIKTLMTLHQFSDYKTCFSSQFNVAFFVLVHVLG